MIMVELLRSTVCLIMCPLMIPLCSCEFCEFNCGPDRDGDVDLKPNFGKYFLAKGGSVSERKRI